MVAQPAAARVLRLSGTDLVPSWRGRLHLGAAVASVPAAAALVAHRPDLPVAGYAVGLVAMLSVSAAYHVARVSPPHRRWWRQADHAVIYLFMALSYVPFCRQAVGGTLGGVLLGLALAAGAAGVAIKLTNFERSAVAGAVLYMVMGWMAVIAMPGAFGTLPAGELALLGGTCLFYTGGAVMFALRWPDPAPEVFGYHEVWHASVIAASACYFAFVWRLGT